jgi:hypothetical protein
MNYATTLGPNVERRDGGFVWLAEATAAVRPLSTRCCLANRLSPGAEQSAVGSIRGLELLALWAHIDLVPGFLGDEVAGLQMEYGDFETVRWICSANRRLAGRDDGQRGRAKRLIAEGSPQEVSHV